MPQFDEAGGFTEYLVDFVSGVAPVGDAIHRVRDFLTAISLVASGVGVALVPESVRRLSLSNIVYRDIDGYERTVGLSLAHRNGEMSPAANAFVGAAATLQRSASA